MNNKLSKTRKIMCKYCTEDRDGYVDGLDKHGHYYIHNDEMILKRYGQRDIVKINYCPMCGRKLNG